MGLPRGPGTEFEHAHRRETGSSASKAKTKKNSSSSSKKVVLDSESCGRASADIRARGSLQHKVRGAGSNSRGQGTEPIGIE